MSRRNLLLKFLIILFLVSLTILQIATIVLEHTTYWAATRGKVVRSLLNQVSKKYPTIPKGSAIYFINDPKYPFVADEWGSSSKQAAFILNNEDALRLYYKDPNLKVFYEDLGGIPDNFPKNKVFTLTAQILNQ